jgi:endonuclease/exonuclease/phosphatase family metal-dependent hydrolase
MALRLSTWNCFGMGQGLSAITATRAPLADRFREAAVVEACASPDVLCVQELLSRDAQVFFDGLGHASTYRDHNRLHLRSVTMRGSGLGIGSRRSLVNTTLGQFSGPSVGWDRLARKGILHAQVPLDGGAILDLLNVHLQSGYDPAAIAVRRRQILSVGDWVERLGAPERPFILCGDFNVDGLVPARGGAEYQLLRSTLSDFEDLGAVDDHPTFHPEGNTLAHMFEPGGVTQRLDYIFFRGARGVRFGPIGVTRILDQPVRPAVFPSDHYGLSASFS